MSQIRKCSFTIKPVFLNVSIHNQIRTPFQERVNEKATKQLNEYWLSFSGLNSKQSTHKETIKECAKLLMAMDKSHSKTQILCSFQRLVYLLNGVRITSCKSGKDRTSMSTTLEQSLHIIHQENDFSNIEKNEKLMKMVSVLREVGSARNLNVLENTGDTKYVLTPLQALLMPKLFIPPRHLQKSIFK